MSKLKELIQSLCPNGVEYKPLGEVCEFQRGQSITAKDAINGNIPVIAGGQKPAYYHNVSNRTGETVVVAGSGAYAGYVSYWNIPIFVSDAFSVNPTNLLCTKYLYYYLKNIQEKIHATKKGSGVPHVHGSSIAKFEIPVPPIEVQEEIVRILDRYTEIAASLQAELQARKEQYEYYRNLLLTFNSTCGGADDKQKNKLTIAPPSSYEIKWKTMGEICDIRNGYTPSKANPDFWEGGTIPWFRMEDIRQNGRILSDSIQHITPQAVKGGKYFPANSIILATTATIGEHALVIADSLANQQFTNLSIRKSLIDKIDIKYFFYYMFIVDEWCKKNTNVSGFASVDMAKFKKLLIPIPPLDVQEKIVAILDKFEAMVSDLSAGLPAEIAARQEQYEYYRNRLLTFPRL